MIFFVSFDFCSIDWWVSRLHQHSVFMLSSGPLVTLDVWRTIKQLFDPNSRHVTLLWTPVNLFFVFPLNIAVMNRRFSFSHLTWPPVVLSVFMAQKSQWTSSASLLSGHRETNTGSSRRTAQRPRRMCLSGQGGATSPSRLSSNAALPSPLTSPSRSGTTQVSDAKSARTHCCVMWIWSSQPGLRGHP